VKLIFANRNYSSWSLRPWLVLKHFGIPFEEDQVLLSGDGWQEKIRKKSPSGKVPVLIDGDATVPESIAIIEYLHDRFPAKGIWPSGRLERATARSVSAEMHGGFGALRGAAPMNMRAHHPGKVPFETVKNDLRRIEEIWGDLTSESGGPYLFGKFTAADAMFAPVASRIKTYDLPVSEVAQDYVAAIHKLPAFVEWREAALKETWVVEDDEIDVLHARAAAK
jgi:glutathione S-transferase